MKQQDHLFKTILLLFLFSFSKYGIAQEIKTAQDYFPKEKAKVLVVGTFHFDYPGLDAHQIEESDKIDVLKEPKKSEVTELVNYIKQFRPNKIALEASPAWKANGKLQKYKSGAYRDARDERFQLGMRLAMELKIDTLYSLDAGSMAEDIAKLDSNYTAQLWEGFDFESEDPFEKYVKAWFEANDKMAKEMNLLSYFKIMNSEESHRANYGTYLIGDFKLDQERGADILSYWWYNRNVRIFRKLQTITESSEDRILVIFGNGHAAVLRQLLEASPEYDFIEFDSL